MTNKTGKQIRKNSPSLSVAVRHLGHGLVVTRIATLLASSHRAWTESNRCELSPECKNVRHSQVKYYQLT